MHCLRTLLVALTTLTMASCTGSKPQPATPAADTTADVEGVCVKTLANGSVVTWIQDNEGDRLNSPDLFSDAPRELIDSLGLSEGLPSSVSTFLLQTDGQTILFDAGLGPQKGGHMLERLATIGITPDSVDMIYLTHLHLDHIGGMMGDQGPVFPHAQVYLSQREYDAWQTEMPQDRTELQRQMLAMYSEQLHLFSFGDTLPGHVLAIDAVGHTPGHTVFQSGELLVIGDLMHGLALQESHPEYCANFDMDKEQSVASRRRVLEYARANQLIMAGMHLPAPGFK